MELSDHIRIFRKNWLWIVLLTVLGLGASAAYTVTRTPTYESTSTIFVSSQAGGTAAELQQGSSFTQARVNTYIGLARTPIVLDPVINRLDLPGTAETLASSVRAAAATNSTLIAITASDTNPERAAATANAVAASLATVVPALEPAATDGSSPIRLSLVSEGQPAAAPASPSIPINLTLGMLVGLALGISFALIRTRLDDRVRTPRDAETITKAPAIGAIAYDVKAQERPLIVHVDPLSPRAESFRALRTNLQFLDMGGRSSFVVTSSIASEGKSTTTINLAIALADAGNRVALVDADLRKPTVADYLGIEGGVGLTDVLIGRAAVDDVMLPWGGRSLFVLPAGKIPPNPSELLGSQKMGSFLAALEEDFDVVLCDAPPLLPVTDAAILARMTSGAIMVVSAGRATKHQLAGATEALNTVGAKLAGFVMSMVPTRGPDSYYSAYGYGYGGYGNVYSREAPAKKKWPRRGSATSATPRRRDQSDRPAVEAGGFSRRSTREAQRSE
ncbi:polysaccharide biosynthesis tyrosine autokinase [Microbacterium proteolyticum]|uniref:polysaccharide biosynthesis tyrosine autokinase n=1 Tax=Microbacterium proteolyticum TaxID=1572644 RepID=UPI0035A83E0B|nr:polysaccharide biosynthesis tyrosine autokinase [Microbacterium proteolyticum]